MAKDSFIKGTLILALAALVARVLGVFQRVPLEHLLGTIGDASFGIANNLYLLLLVVATAGIPSTLSKMISERIALGRNDEAQRIYYAAILFGFVAGIVITVLLIALAPLYATYVSKVPEAAMSIRAIAPALLLFPVIAMMRGYYQGRQLMTAGGVSQIIEQILRVLTAVGLAYILFFLDYSDEWVAAGASFGGVFGSIGAFAVMIYYARKLKRTGGALKRTSSGGRKLSLKEIYAEIFRMSIPIVLTSMAVPLIYFIDSSIVVSLLQGDIGADAAKQELAILTIRAQSIAGIPPILAVALSQSIIPVISSAFAKRDMANVSRQATMAMRISIFSGVPIVAALCVASGAINGLLFSNLEGTGIIALLTFGAIFQITMMTSGSILTGLGATRQPMYHVIVGIIVKLVGSFALAPFFGIYGIVFATTLCFLISTLFNLMSIRKRMKFTLLGSKWVGFLLAVAIMSGVGFGLEMYGANLVDWINAKLAYFIVAVVVGGVMMALYPVLLILLKVVNSEDIAGYPAPLRKVMGKLLRLLNRSRGNARQDG